MDSADLVARLRDWANTYEEGHHHPVASRMFAAADRIAALEAWKAEAMEVLRPSIQWKRDFKKWIKEYEGECSPYAAYHAGRSAAGRLVEKEDGRGPAD